MKAINRWVCTAALLCNLQPIVFGEIKRGVGRDRVKNSAPAKGPPQMPDYMSPNVRYPLPKLIDSVIFEPYPKVKLSRSSYKVIGFINFDVYHNAFNKMRKYMARFKSDLYNTKVAGPLYNVGLLGAERDESGPMASFIKKPCKGQECFMVKQMKLLRYEIGRAKVLYDKIYTQFTEAIRDLEEIKVRDVRKEVPEHRGYYEVSKKDSSTFLKARHKRIVGIYAAYRSHKNAEEISELKNTFETMEKHNRLQQDQILELGAFLNVTHGYVTANRLVINEIQVRLTELNATLLSLMDTFNVHQYIVFFLIEARASMSRINMGMLTLQQNVQGIYEYLRVISTHRINPLVIPPRDFKIILKGVRDKLSANPRLRLPENPETHLWKYYYIARVIPIVTKSYLLIILTMPLIDTSLQMNLYKVHNLPIINPPIGTQHYTKDRFHYKYVVEGEYFAVSYDKAYVSVPPPLEIQTCQATDGYLCLMNQAMYPTSTNNWCIYSLFIKDRKKIDENCHIKVELRSTTVAVSLGGYMWAISPIATEKIQIRCLEESRIVTIKPPLTLLEIGNGCEGYSPSIYIPAKSQMSSENKEAFKQTFFMDFNDEYQNLSRNALISRVSYRHLSEKEKELLPGILASIPPLKFDALNKRIEDIPYEANIKVSSNTALMVTLGLALVLVGVIGFILWRVYRNRTRVKQFKPMTRVIDQVDDFHDMFSRFNLGSFRSSKREAPPTPVPLRTFSIEDLPPAPAPPPPLPRDRAITPASTAYANEPLPLEQPSTDSLTEIVRGIKDEPIFRAYQKKKMQRQGRWRVN